MKPTYLAALGAVVLVTALSPAFAQTPARKATARPAAVAVPAVASATASFTSTNIAVGVGYSWGHGVLSYRGRTYPFTVKGLNALGIGASTMNGTAEIFNLRNLNDFAGVYGAAGAVVLIILWVYYSAIILYFGAEFTKVYANKYGGKIRPGPFAVFVEVKEVVAVDLVLNTEEKKA